jgi:hypothetical protein
MLQASERKGQVHFQINSEHPSLLTVPYKHSQVDLRQISLLSVYLLYTMPARSYPALSLAQPSLA